MSIKTRLRDILPLAFVVLAGVGLGGTYLTALDSGYDMGFTSGVYSTKAAIAKENLIKMEEELKRIKASEENVSDEDDESSN